MWLLHERAHTSPEPVRKGGFQRRLHGGETLAIRQNEIMSGGVVRIQTYLEKTGKILISILLQRRGKKCKTKELLWSSLENTDAAGLRMFLMFIFKQ